MYCPRRSLGVKHRSRTKDRRDRNNTVNVYLVPVPGKMQGEGQLYMYGRLRDDIEIEMHLHGPMNCAKTSKLLFRVGDLHLPEVRKRVWISLAGTTRRKCVGAQMCSCGRVIELNSYSGGV